MTSQAGSPLAWRDGDIVMVSATALVGLVAIMGGWFGAGDARSMSAQAAWLNLAIAGLAVFAVGNCLWLRRGRRAVGAKRASLVALDLGEEPPPDGRAPAGHPQRRSEPAASLRLVRTEGMSRVHHVDCPLVSGKHLRQATTADGQPCGVCSP